MRNRIIALIISLVLAPVAALPVDAIIRLLPGADELKSKIGIFIGIPIGFVVFFFVLGKVNRWWPE